MRRALCVGIDQYTSDPLQGCVADAARVETLLRKHQDGAPNFDTMLLSAPIGGGNTRVTRAGLRERIDNLFKDPADVALFYFSGHGTVNNLDGYLVTQDARAYDEGVAMNDVLKWANDSKADEV